MIGALSIIVITLTRMARSRLHCLKPNPERMINGPTDTLVRRRCGSGADPKA